MSSTVTLDIPGDPTAPGGARRAIGGLRATDVGGRGLRLVQTLSDRWGVYAGSAHVWLEIDGTTGEGR